MVVNFVCRKSKISKRDGLCPLELYVIIDGKRKFISLDRKIDYKLFNAKKQVVKDDIPESYYPNHSKTTKPGVFPRLY